MTSDSDILPSRESHISSRNDRTLSFFGYDFVIILTELITHEEYFCIFAMLEVFTIFKSIMALFSERYNYTNPSDVIIRERITPEIQNAICSCYDELRTYFKVHSYNSYSDYVELERYLWTYFLNNRVGNFDNHIVATAILEDSNIIWYKKIDLVEQTIKYLNAISQKQAYSYYYSAFERFVKHLNFEFKRLNFGYRVIGTEIIEITSEEEIEAIKSAVNGSPDNIRAHLNSALVLYAERPEGDYRNSIKESISAVEAYCREKTSKNTLGNALNELKNKGFAIPNVLIIAFEKLYAYTNQPNTGIRHALMENESGYEPGPEEALFMLVSCSSFINYLNKKLS